MKHLHDSQQFLSPAPGATTFLFVTSCVASFRTLALIEDSRGYIRGHTSAGTASATAISAAEAVVSAEANDEAAAAVVVPETVADVDA